MPGDDILAQRFEANRAHLRSVAYRMLGSGAEADDAVQEAFLRVGRAGADDIGNFTGWLTTIVARVCLDMLRTRESRHEIPIEAEAEALAAPDDAERERLMSDSIGIAMLTVLETLSPAERVAFVLHDVFDLPFDAIAPVVGRSPAATRQLASRGRRRVRGAPNDLAADREKQRQLVEAFLAASQGGDLSALLAVLDADVVLRADAAAVAASLLRAGGDMPLLEPEIRGRDAVAAIFRGRAKAARLALLDGDAGLAFVQGGTPRLLVEFVVEAGRIAEIAMAADPGFVAGRVVALCG